MSCLTILFQATKRSIRMSDGFKSCGAIFFFIRDWLRETEEPCLLALDIEVAREREAAVSWFMVGVELV